MLDGQMSSGRLDANMINAMCRKAGEIGANGLILSDIRHASDGVVAATSIASAVLKAPGSIDVPTRANAVAIQLKGGGR